jgi:hypothetical protein
MEDSLLEVILLALSLIANVCLFLSLKYEFLRESRKHRQAVQALADCIKETVKRETSLQVSLPALPVALYPNPRIEVARRWRAGEGAEEIAAALGITRNEVELLIRVEQMAPLSGTSIQE